MELEINWIIIVVLILESLMEVDRSITKVAEPDDPNRCQAACAYGQCPNKAIPGGTHCMVHGGNKQADKIEKESTDMYRVDIFKARIARHKNHDGVKSLSNEVAILRMLMEEKLRGCTNDTELLLAAAAIGDLVMKIDRVVVSCHKLEKNLGQHLDKGALLQFAGEVVSLIGNCVTDKNEVKAVADGILKIIGGQDE